MRQVPVPVFLPLLALLGGCATVVPRPDGDRWLTGAWLMLEPDVEYPLGCSSGLPVRYDGDGTYRLFGEAGTWRLQGERLTETATEILPSGDPDAIEIGRPYVSRIARIDADAFRKTFADGETATFRRCPPPPE